MGKEKTIRERAIKAVAEEMGKKPEEVRDGMTWEDLDADSLDTIEIIFAIEEEFGIEVPDSAADAMANVGDLVAWLERQEIT